jgi:hypothetical protein
MCTFFNIWPIQNVDLKVSCTDEEIDPLTRLQRLSLLLKGEEAQRREFTALTNKRSFEQKLWSILSYCIDLWLFRFIIIIVTIVMLLYLWRAHYISTGSTYVIFADLIVFFTVIHKEYFIYYMYLARMCVYYRCGEAVKLFRFLLSPYILIRTCNNV